jgi:hypothetical protein
MVRARGTGKHSCVVGEGPELFCDSGVNGCAFCLLSKPLCIQRPRQQTHSTTQSRRPSGADDTIVREAGKNFSEAAPFLTPAAKVRRLVFLPILRLPISKQQRGGGGEIKRGHVMRTAPSTFLPSQITDAKDGVSACPTSYTSAKALYQPHWLNILNPLPYVTSAGNMTWSGVKMLNPVKLFVNSAPVMSAAAGS